MKKIYTILTLLLALSLSVSANNPFKAKQSVKKQQVETRNATLRNLLPSGNIVPDSAYVTNRDGELIEKRTYSRDSEGRIIETSSYRDSDGYGAPLNTWVINARTSFKLDSIGRVLEEIEEYYNSDEQIWIKSSMETNQYREGDKLLQDRYYQFDQDQNRWILEEATYYEYDENGHIVGYNEYESEDINGDGNTTLVQTYKVRCDYTIDTEGYLNYLVYFKDMKVAGSDFGLGLKVKQKYNADHFLIYTEDAELIEGEWDEPSKEERVYENGKLISEKQYGSDDNGATWYLEEEKQYTYNAKGQLVKEVIYESDEDTHEVYINSTKELFYTNDQSSIETEEADSNVKISIENGVLNVDSNQAETISVYSVAGLQIASFDKTEGEASTTINSKGVVVVKGTSGWAKKAISK